MSASAGLFDCHFVALLAVALYQFIFCGSGCVRWRGLPCEPVLVLVEYKNTFEAETLPLRAVAALWRMYTHPLSPKINKKASQEPHCVSLLNGSCGGCGYINCDRMSFNASSVVLSKAIEIAVSSSILWCCSYNFIETVLLLCW